MFDIDEFEKEDDRLWRLLDPYIFRVLDGFDDFYVIDVDTLPDDLLDVAKRWVDLYNIFYTYYTNSTKQWQFEHKGRGLYEHVGWFRDRNYGAFDVYAPIHSTLDEPIAIGVWDEGFRDMMFIYDDCFDVIEESKDLEEWRREFFKNERVEEE